MSSEKDISEVYEDRNLLALALARAAYDQGHRAYWYLHDEWAVVCIDLPSGQVSWHVRPDISEMPDWLPRYDGTDNFDGHSREEKNDRLRAYFARGEGDD